MASVRVVLGIILVTLLLFSTIQNQSHVSSIPLSFGMKEATTTTTTNPLYTSTAVPKKTNQTRPSSSKFHTRESYKPVTSLLPKCNPDPSQTLEIVDSFPNYQNVSWNDTNDNGLPVAACQFVEQQHSTHFAHTMQQLYACWAFWQRFPSKKSILILPSPNLKWKLAQNPFLRGFLEALESSSSNKIETLSQQEFDERYINFANQQNTITPHRMTTYIEGGYVMTHAHELSQLVAKHLNIAPRRHCGPFPRIALLNRRRSKGRSVLNAINIVDRILNKTAGGVAVDEVPNQYFEGLSFEEQFRFFQSVDILVSPHGAQLTGLAFLHSSNSSSSSPCSQLLELFPKGYSIPHFYGSLAINSGIGYSYLYLSAQPWQSEQQQAESIDGRARARAADLCPSPDAIVDALSFLTTRWKQCCAKNII